MAMARKLRVEYAGALYHVTARGNDRQRIFRTDADRKRWVALLAERLERYEVTLYAYVQMDNHYHLVVQTAHPNLSRFMHALNTAYTVWSNRRNRRTGHLFEGPYRAIAMEEGSKYLLTVTGYVNLNPVRTRAWAGKSPGERLQVATAYPWSSFGAYLHPDNPTGTLPIAVDRVFGELGARTQREGVTRYRDYLRGWLQKEADERRKPSAERDNGVLNPLHGTRCGCFLGGDPFRDFIQGLLGPDRTLRREVVGYRQWCRERPLDEVLNVICAARGVDPAALHQRGWHQVERDTVLFLCREIAEKPLSELGEALALGASAVWQAHARVARRIQTDSAFAKSVASSRAAIIKILKT